MRRAGAAKVVSLYVAAGAIGVLSAWLWLTKVDLTGIDAGAWRVNLVAGSVDADAYTRARIAIGALLALDRRETLYYTTERDDSGRRLQADCHYDIALRAPPARWWSVTAYAADGFLFPNASRRYSVGGENILVSRDDQIHFSVGPERAEGASATHIPTRGRGSMRLTLRLYQPAEALQRAPQSLAAPQITRRSGCPS